MSVCLSICLSVCVCLFVCWLYLKCKRTVVCMYSNNLYVQKFNCVYQFAISLTRIVGQLQSVSVSFCFSKLLPNAGMEFSLYVFLLTLFVAHDKLSTSSSPSRNTRNGVQQLPLDNISPEIFASKDTKTIGVFNNNCQSFNKFGHFSSWTCNSPRLAKFASAELVIKPSMRIQKYRYRILVFEEIPTTETGDTILDDATSYKTWIYYEETDSWKMIASVANGLPRMPWLRLVTICNSHAIILSPDAINSTWIFVFEQLRWNRVEIVGDRPSWTDIRYDIFAVAVESEHSLYSCSQDIFVFYTMAM